MICVLRRVVAIGMLISIAAPVQAHGDPAPAADKKQVARQYVEAGLAAQHAGDYDTAVTLYQKAYQLVPHPVLIFNIAQAYRLAGRLKEAATLYKRYVSEAPDGDQAPIARDFIAEIEAEQARSARKPDEPVRSAPSTSASRGAEHGEPARSQAPAGVASAGAATAGNPSLELAGAERQAAPAQTVPVSGDVADDAHAWSARLPLLVGVGGAALLVGAGGMALWANSTYDAADNEHVDQRRRDSLEDSANTRRHVALGLLGAGLVCGGVATWLYIRQRHGEHTASAASAHVIPLLDGSGAGLAVRGGF